MATKNKMEQRILQTNERLLKAGEYYNYLPRIIDAYIGSVKTFTAISSALIAAPFLSWGQFSAKVEAGSSVAWLIIAAWACLGISVISGACYQLFAVQAVEDEVEFEGKEYHDCIRKMRRWFRATMGGMIAGIGLTVIYMCMLLFSK